MPITPKLRQRWPKWWKSLPSLFEIPRAKTTLTETRQGVVLHCFGDASKHDNSTAIYAVEKQREAVSQGLLTSKARLSK